VAILEITHTYLVIIIRIGHYFDEWVNYGAYDFLINGFVSIHNHFKDLVIPIVGKNKDGDNDIGTAFFLKPHLVITAGHCVKDLSHFRLQSLDGTIFETSHVYFHKNPNIDIAVLKLLTN
jgi:hypothetical protein